jgi:hypothetical protein
MTQGELLARIAAELERANIPYMLVGSLNAEQLDFHYIEGWVRDLGLSAMWEIAQEMAAP